MVFSVRAEVKNTLVRRCSLVCLRLSFFSVLEATRGSSRPLEPLRGSSRPLKALDASGGSRPFFLKELKALGKGRGL